MSYLQGESVIASKDVGQVLRVLGQNPTEDQVVQMVMKVGRLGVEWNGKMTNHVILQANCDWEGQIKKSVFLGVGPEIGIYLQQEGGRAWVCLPRGMSRGP